MPVIGRGRGKFVSGKSKLFSGVAGSITTRDNRGSENNGVSWGNNSNSAGGGTTDAWGNVQPDTGNTDRFADPNKEVEMRFEVYNSNLGRIIGKAGSNIQSIKDETSAEIDIMKKEAGDETTPVVLKGSQMNVDHAKKMIDELCDKFNGKVNNGAFEMIGNGNTTSNGGASNGFGGSSGGFGGSSGGFGSGGGFGGMSATDDGPSSDEDIWVPEDKCGRIIGRAGSKIQEIQEDTGANVKVHGRETAENGKVMVTLTGTDGQRAKARSIIEDLTKERGGGGGGSNFFQVTDDMEALDMWVASFRIGRVVGKGGSKIREISETYSVKVDISKTETKGDDTLVTLTGLPDNTKNAKDYIDELCERNADQGIGNSNGGGDSWGQPAASDGWGTSNDTNTGSGWGTSNDNNTGTSGGWGTADGAVEW